MRLTSSSFLSTSHSRLTAANDAMTLLRVSTACVAVCLWSTWWCFFALAEVESEQREPPSPLYPEPLSTPPTRPTGANDNGREIPHDTLEAADMSADEPVSRELPELAARLLAYQHELVLSATRDSDTPDEGNSSLDSPSNEKQSDAKGIDADDKKDMDDSRNAASLGDPKLVDTDAPAMRVPDSNQNGKRATATQAAPSPLPTSDHLYAAAESIKETIRSEQKSSAFMQTHEENDEVKPAHEPTPTHDDNESDDQFESSKGDPLDASSDEDFANEDVEYEEASTSSEEDFDDRTLLDIFGESAKEYLTQRVIPETDIDCMWDWRSLRCEPSCQCTFAFQSGDYHLGRSCRKRPVALDICEPTVFIQDKPIPKRILSLIRQTTDIVTDKVKMTTSDLVQTTTHHFGQLQDHVCLDLRSRWHENPATGLPCWSTVPETTLWEKMLCGRMEGPLCDDVPLRAANAPIVAAAAKMDRHKDGSFGDLYKTEI